MKHWEGIWLALPFEQCLSEYWAPSTWPEWPHCGNCYLLRAVFSHQQQKSRFVFENAPLLIGLLVLTMQRLTEKMHFPVRKMSTREFQKGLQKLKCCSSTWDHYIWNQLSKCCILPVFRVKMYLRSHNCQRKEMVFSGYDRGEGHLAGQQ